MTTRVGIGSSENASSYEAAREAAAVAWERVGTSACDLVVLFATGKHDPVAVRDGLRSVVGGSARIIGGSTAGIITNDTLGYGPSHVGVALLSSDSFKCDLFIEPGIKGAEYDKGISLGRQIRQTEFIGEPNLLLIYDSVKQSASEGQPLLNFATPLIEGMTRSLERWPPVAGVGVMADPQFFYPAAQWFDDRIERHSAMTLALSGRVKMDTLILHGCKPASDYHTITKAMDNVVLEIDGKPALDMIADLLGPESGIRPDGYPFFITLGVNRGDKFGPYVEANYANRLCLAVDSKHRALVMFEPDLRPGSEVQLMRRSIDFGYIGKAMSGFLASLGDRKPIFALYIDCLGRAAAFSGIENEEAAEVQKYVGTRMPLLGVYSGVEIARVGGSTQPLDWTGVLCVLSE